jgi:nucleoside-diphosphate-sugar epimerase/ribosomal protein S18 acetylase RimI-like enzyme
MAGVAGRRIALIGGAGFIGHNLALRLAQLGAKPFVVDSLAVNNYYSIKKDSADIPNGSLYLKIIEQRLDLLRQHDIPLVEADSRDYHRLSAVLAQVDPDAVIHLAAVAHAGKSNKDPYSTFDHSLRTLENALDVSRSPRRKIGHFIYFSSSMVYGNFVSGMVTEETPCEPLGIYGALKYAGEKMVIAYNQVFKLPYTIVRPSALYGERCVSRRVGQVFIENALQGLDISINGDGSERLDFTYIGDLVHGIVCVLEHENAKNQTFNLTYGQSRSTAEMADILRQQFPDAKIKYLPKDSLTPNRGTLSVEKARRLIGYEPTCPLEKGFLDYIAWYKSLWSELQGRALSEPVAAADPPTLKADPWLTNLIGHDAYSLAVTPELIQASGGKHAWTYSLFREAQAKNVFITAKVPVSDPAARAFLEEHGFRLIDTNVRFERVGPPVKAPPAKRPLARFAEPADRDAVMELARRAFTFSRFHQDPLISKSLADEIKAQWAGNYFAGKRGDRMVVAVVDSKIVGFTLLLTPSLPQVMIDLIAVDWNHRGSGIASEMIAFIEQQYQPSSMLVGTQVANLPSVRLYEKLGFRLVEAQYVFHFHNPPVSLDPPVPRP